MPIWDAAPSRTTVRGNAGWCTFWTVSRTRLRRFTCWGDIFDFWYEYKTVVPRGYTRFLREAQRIGRPGRGGALYGQPRHLVRRLLGEGMRRDAAHRADDGGDGRQGVHAGARRRLATPTASSVSCVPCSATAFANACFPCIHPRWAVDFGLSWRRIAA